MADKFSKDVRSRIMSSIRSQDTKIEITFRKTLWSAGYRYRKNSSKMLGKPDVVLRKYKTVIFIDSCFWHRCPYHFKKPKSNLRYWNPKIKRNKERDKEVTYWYRRKGWKVLRFWEHRVNKSLESCINKTIDVLLKQAKVMDISLKS
jgi:DNA mismatch endonuclease (patch repair protein)